MQLEVLQQSPAHVSTAYPGYTIICSFAVVQPYQLCLFSRLLPVLPGAHAQNVGAAGQYMEYSPHHNE